MARRMVDPMIAELTRREVDEAQLRSEIVVAALIGISLGRSLGWFEELKAVPRARLVDLLSELLDRG